MAMAMTAAAADPLIWHDQHNAEPPSALLSREYYTPLEVVFKRNHGDVPLLDDATHELEFVVDSDAVAFADGKACGQFAKLEPRKWSMKELKERYTAEKVTAAIECAGNRRSEMNEERQTEGIPWQAGVIANLEWEGPLLRDILLDIGVPDPYSQGLADPAPWAEGLHVHFESSQKCSDADWYGSSIPLSTAMDPNLPILLAYKHNNVPLLPQHGHPLRVLIPGHIGARSVKWLSRIRLAAHESTNFYMQEDYKVVLPRDDEDLARIRDNECYRRERLKGIRPLMVMGIGGAITVPEEGARVEGRSVRCSGYAIGENGAPITRVEVTALPTSPSSTSEEIKSLASLSSTQWTQATLQPSPPSSTYKGKEWGWKLWDAEVPLPAVEEVEAVALVMRAWCGDKMQERTSAWNVRGVAVRGWSVVKGLRVG